MHAWHAALVDAHAVPTRLVADDAARVSGAAQVSTRARRERA
jgi:hypothetical protein